MNSKSGVKDISFLLKQLSQIKPKYEKEGLIILGIFGSYTNNSATKDSDIDILYDITLIYSAKKSGFSSL